MTKSQSPPERVAIVGSRETSKARAEAVREYIQTLPVGTIIVTGDCPSGVDNYVRSTAAYVGVELVVCHAAWDR